MNQLLTMALLSLLSQSTWAGRPPVSSLNDLPRRWDGVAGNLLVQEQATFKINRITRVVRDEKPNGFIATYDVDATFTAGARSIAVTSIELSSSIHYGETYWLTFKLNDALIPRLAAALTYDEATNLYSLKEMPRDGGERRFALTAPAAR